MLFIISKEAGAMLLAPLISRQTITAYSRLLDSYSDGHHVVIIEPNLCRIVESGSIFSTEQKATAKRIRNKFAEYGGLPSRLVEYATVIVEGLHPVKVASGWEVPLQWLAMNPLLKSAVLGEDLHDTLIFVAAAEDFLEISGLRSFSVRAAETAGGGKNTHRVLKNIAIRNQQICVCIVDSDRICPSSTPGPTAVPCMTPPSVSLHVVRLTDGRSLENALPWRLIDQVRESRNPAVSVDLARLKRSHLTGPMFLNFKKGISGFDIAKLNCAISKKYWTDVAEKAVGRQTCCSIPCDASASPLCKYKVHGGFGSSLLADVAMWLNDTKPAARVKKYFPSPNSTEWTDIGRLIAIYTFGLPPRRI